MQRSLFPYYYKSVKFSAFCFILVILFALNGCRPREKDGQTPIDPLLEKGNKAMNDKNWHSAIEHFSEALLISPDNTELLYRRAVVRLAQAKDHYDLAEAAIIREDIPIAEEEAKIADDLCRKVKEDSLAALKNEPKSFDIHYILGCLYIYQGDWNGAIDEFSQCIKIDPKNPLPYQRRGEVYGYTGDSMNETVDLKQAAELGYSE